MSNINLTNDDLRSNILGTLGILGALYSLGMVSCGKPKFCITSHPDVSGEILLVLLPETLQNYQYRGRMLWVLHHNSR